MLKRLRHIGIFSVVINVITVAAIIIIFYITNKIWNMSIEEANSSYNLELNPEDRDYALWVPAGIPGFCAAMMNLFEGNQQILNLYAENDKPTNFYPITMGVIITILIFLAIPTGYFGYLAFGDSVKSVLIMDLPYDDTLSVIAKLFYSLTIMGSFVIIIQPIYYVIERTEKYKSMMKPKSEEEIQEIKGKR